MGMTVCGHNCFFSRPSKLSSVAVWVRSNRLFGESVLVAAGEVARHGHDRVWS